MIDRRDVLLSLPIFVFAPVAARSETGMIAVTEVDWRYLADTVMGGVSQGQARLEGDALRLTGTVSTANNGGFIQVRTALPDGAPQTATGLRLRVRGDGQRYFIHLRTTDASAPWHFYQAGFETGSDLREVTLPLAAFQPSRSGMPPVPAATGIRSLALVAYGRDHEADVSLFAFGWD